MGDEEKLPFTEHLEELRSRLIKSFIAVGVGFAASYGFKGRVFHVWMQPLQAVMGGGE